MSTEALLLSPALRRFVALVALFFVGVVGTSYGASHRTSNFIVQAEDAEFAKVVAEQAEEFRVTLSNLWLGAPLKRWAEPCVITVVEGVDETAAGETIYTFSRGEVFDWKMRVQGTRARILDSVLPHEITHTILASYLRAPAPRWIDEGMATSVEAETERANYRNMLVSFLFNRRGISFNDMVAMKEYPRDLTPFYSQSFSVCEYLILVGGHKRLVKFAKLGMERRDWDLALREYYDCNSLGDLQTEWNSWLQEWTTANRPERLPATRKMPEIDVPIIPETMIASHESRAPLNANRHGFMSENAVTRGQSSTQDRTGLLGGFPRLLSGRNTPPAGSASEATWRSGSTSAFPQYGSSATLASPVRSHVGALTNGAGTATRVVPHRSEPRYYPPISQSR